MGPRAPARGTKRPDHEAPHSPLPNAEVNNDGALPPPYIMAWGLINRSPRGISSDSLLTAPDTRSAAGHSAAIPKRGVDTHWDYDVLYIVYKTF
jgi:hypothetical protein